MKVHTIAMLVAVTIASSLASAQIYRQSGPGKDFVRPVYQNKSIDWCLHWGVECGKPAADYFCRMSGYGEASRFDTGFMTPTLVMGDREMCRTGCTGFTRINCTALRRDKGLEDDWSGRTPPPQPPPYEEPGYDDGRSVNIPVPMIDGQRVDWCVYFGSECGKPAADLFCQRQGYAGSESFDRRMTRPTLVMGANQLCTLLDCTALVNVRCTVDGNSRSPRRYDRQPGYSDASPNYPFPASGYSNPTARDAGKVFKYPMWDGMAVDRCLHWGVECGKPAADQFCKLNGYRGSVGFDVMMKRPTLVLGENQICNRSDCSSFSRIECSNYSR